MYSRYENDEKVVNENDAFVNRVTKEFGVTSKSLMAEDGNAAIFESGNIATAANGMGQIENYYSLPKDFMDAYFKQQQQMLEQILNVLAKK